MASVVFQDAYVPPDRAVAGVFDAFGGGRALLKSSGDVYIKVNGIDFKPHVYTSPSVVAAVIRYFKSHGARRIFVIENSTQGNITRLVFEITGLKRACRENHAIPVYLDETGEAPMYLPGLDSHVMISDFVNEHLIRKREENLYISIPKLKSHSMTTITLGLKNQFGLLHHESRIADHNYKLHQKIADIYANIRPDFTLVDGLEATNHGHYPAVAQADRCVVPLYVLFGGGDPLAVDVVGARFLGFELDEVEHLRLAASYDMGESRFERIKIENKNLFDERKQAFSAQLLELFPKDVKILYGATRCCTEGCKRNTQAVLEVFAQDFGGRGKLTVLMGKDIDPAAIADIDGPVHLAGDCAIADWYGRLHERLGEKMITLSPGCNNLAATINGLAKWLHVKPLDLVPMHPAKSLALLLRAKLAGTRANIPPLL